MIFRWFLVKKKTIGWLLKPRGWSNTYLHVWIFYFLLRKKINTSALLLVKCPFHQGWIFAKSSWGANHLPALPYVFSRWQVSRLCHASVYGGSRLSLGRQGDFFWCWSTFAETKIWPIQIIQNATRFIESLVLHLSVQGCREAHLRSPMCCLAKKKRLKKIEKWCISILAGYMQNSAFQKKKTCSIFVFGGWLSTGERGRHYLEAHFGASDIQSTLGSSSSEERKEEDMRKQIEDRTRWLNALARKSALMDGEIWGDGEMGRWRWVKDMVKNHSFSKIGTCKKPLPS